jgi:hypothetical protein
VDGVKIASDTQYTFANVTASHTIRATFVINTFTITSSAGANGTISPTPNVVINYGADQHFSIVPNNGYHVDSLIVDGVKITSDTQYTFTNVTASHIIRATFAINTFTITSFAGANGTISPTPGVSVNYGGNQHFSIAPNTGYHVDSLIVDGANITSDTQYTFLNVTSSHTIRAIFARTGFIITSSVGPHGSISPLGSVFVPSDSNQAFAITPAIGWRLDSLLVDGFSQPLASVYIFSTVKASHTIRVVFKAEAYNISIASGDWSQSATWSLGTVPVNTDSVIIGSGTVVRLDINGVCGAFNLLGRMNYSNNSGRTLTVTTAGSRSGNVIIADTLNFASQSDQRMFVGGNLSCTGTIINNSNGATGSFFVFNGAGSRNLSSGVTIRGLQVSNASLLLNLIQPLTIQAGINLTNGRIVLGNNDLTLLPTASIGSGSASSYIVTNGTGKFIRTVTAAADTFPIGTITGYNRVTLATGTSSDVFGIRIISSINPPSAKDSAAVQRTIDLNRTGTDSLGLLTMTVLWNASEQGSLFVPASASSWHFDGSAWVEEGTFTPSGTGPFVGTISNITNTGKYVIGNAGALPITLGDFSGRMVDQHSVKIEWATISEQSTYGFYIQRRGEHEPLYTDVSSFIGGAGTTLNEQKTYSWIDTGAAVGAYYYRLRTIDLNGDVEYSFPIRINIVLSVKDRVPISFKLNQNYPNPFNPSTKITFDLPERGNVTLKIYNIIGQEVAVVLDGNQYNAGSYSQPFNAGAFASGVYYYRLTVTGASHTYESMKKMILLK